MIIKCALACKIHVISCCCCGRHFFGLWLLAFLLASLDAVVCVCVCFFVNHSILITRLMLIHYLVLSLYARSLDCVFVCATIKVAVTLVSLMIEVLISIGFLLTD